MNKTFLLLPMLALLLVGCKTKQSAVTTPATIKDATYFCTQVAKNEPRFTSLNISKMEMGITLNQQTWNLYGSLKMMPDSFIFISLQPLFGFEMFRMEFYPSHFRIVDKMNRNYFEADYDYFQTRINLPLDFKLLENVFSAHLFVLGRTLNETNYNDIFTLERTSDAFILNSTSGDGKILHRIAVSPEYLIGQTNLSFFLGGNSILVSYSEYKEQKGSLYPSGIRLDFHSPQVVFSGIFDISKFILNKPTDATPFALERYNRVTFDQLLKN